MVSSEKSHIEDEDVVFVHDVLIIVCIAPDIVVDCIIYNIHDVVDIHVFYTDVVLVFTMCDVDALTKGDKEGSPMSGVILAGILGSSFVTIPSAPNGKPFVSKTASDILEMGLTVSARASPSRCSGLSQ